MIERARLVGIGLVDSPSYPDSTAEVRRRRGGGGRVRSRIDYGREMSCDCLGGDCTTIVIEPGVLDRAVKERLSAGDDVLAIVGNYSKTVASARHGTLKYRDTPEGFEVDFGLPATQSSKELLEQSTVAPVIVRPIFDPKLSELELRDGVQYAKRLHLKAFVIGSTDRSGGWEPAKIDPPGRAALIDDDYAPPPEPAKVTRIRRWL